MKPLSTIIAAIGLALALAAPASAAPEDFGIESVDVSLSTTQAGDHPDVTIGVAVKQDPSTEPNVFGLKDSFGTTRHIRFDTPPGLIGDPNVLGVPQQCTAQELITYSEPGGGCPNGSQIGRSRVLAYNLSKEFTEPLYMMAPPGGDVVARLGLIAGIYPTFIDLRVRSESDYGLVAEVRDATTAARLVQIDTTLWGVPAASVHDTERCTPDEVFKGCVASESRPPGSRELPFMTNPTRCGVPLTLAVTAASWEEPERFEENRAEAPFPTITGCNKLPFGPSLTVEPTSHRPSSPTGMNVTLRLPASEGVKVLEPSQVRDIVVNLPQGLEINTAASDGLATCSADQVNFGERVSAECPDAAKMADAEFDVAALPRRMKGAIYLREPEPGNPFRIWIVADDLGAHVKLEGQLHIDLATGEIDSIVLDAPQAPVREVKLAFKSGFRAPLITPPACGTYLTGYEFTPWSGGPPASGNTEFTIDEGCAGLGGFSPELSAGSTDASAGRHSPFVFTLTREDGEQNPASLAIDLPRGLAATFAGIPRCEGLPAQTGACPPASRVGKVIAAVGAGPAPLWVPQADKRPTAVYLAGPYKGAPLSIVAVVPRQAGPFDFGDEVVRSAIYVDPRTAQATAVADPLPQRIEGIPILYRTLHVELDRPGFSLNPTNCERKFTTAHLTSTQGALANPSSPFHAVNCAKLGFKPRISLKLKGGTKRGDHPAFKAVVRPREGDANLASTVVTLPRSAFLDQAHIRTICTRVQFAAKACPAGSIYGKATAYTPLLDEPLTGPVYLRSSDNNLPDMVFALHGLLDIEAVGRIDSLNGGIRSSFESIPDAPLSKVVLEMQGGKKGLIVNSRNLCKGTNRADVRMGAQNGKRARIRPQMKADCPKGRKGKRGR